MIGVHAYAQDAADDQYAPLPAQSQSAQPASGTQTAQAQSSQSYQMPAQTLQAITSAYRSGNFPQGLGAQGQNPPFGGRFRGFGRNRGMGRQQGSAATAAGQYTVSFDNADIASVVKFLSLISKVPVVIDPDLKGNITILCANPVSLQEVYDIINAALRVRGFTMIGGLDSKVIRVTSLKKAITDNPGIASGALSGTASDGNLITQVVPLDYASSDSLRDQLKNLISSDQASIVSIASTNTLIITDSAANIKKLLEVIKNVDKDTTGLIVAEVHQCKYANADNLAATLNALFQPKTGTTGVGANMPPGAMGRRGGGGPGGGAPGGQPATTPDLSLASLRGQINISSDSRTNRLVISGTRDRINVVLDVVKQLDVDTEPEVKVKFFPLQYADAGTVATQLNGMFDQPQGSSSSSQSRGFSFFGGQTQTTTDTSAYAGLKRNVAVADVRTNSIIVTATDQNMKSFETMIAGLDAPKVLSEVTRVYPLKFAHSDDLAPVLTKLFAGNTNTANGNRTGGGGFGAIFGLGSSSSNSQTGPLALLQEITVISDPKTNSLLVTGPPSSTQLMDDLIPKLDKRTAEVFIEVAIVDVDLNHDNQFGVEWQWQDGAGGHSLGTNFGVSTGDQTGLKYSILNDNLSVLLRALTTRNDVKVISTPTITTADNIQAKISIGADQPVPSSQVINNVVVNTVEYKTVAVALTVTPHVNGSSDVIGLDLNQTINEIEGTDPLTDAPIIADRSASTSVTVRDGQTMVIGGIIKTNKTKITKGVPLLADLPLVGGLFRSTSDTTERTELMVFLTPRILKTEQDIQDVNSVVRSRLSESPNSILQPSSAPQVAPVAPKAQLAPVGK
jgi:general secretion pathway protein D